MRPVSDTVIVMYLVRLLFFPPDVTIEVHPLSYGAPPHLSLQLYHYVPKYNYRLHINI